ncbi:IclR family transcriptional regulator [Solwaraspora sp. WMMD1047]|uniref:IclR family transcriptional regulator n=1 Tax=Solwaraspora sp. WMMD1047 TaxID=3016102 RepID=UPI002415C463|nr:IclR family transcriptional regulator [Solwaraspora sp. WMMD1047]MDG4831369.1 IclR family transcriptional regulator [Solwaraspora sp. WMMD1047]
MADEAGPDRRRPVPAGPRRGLVGADGHRSSVTSRVLGILAAFDSRHPTLSLSDIARRAGLPLATAHRLVGELAGWGALHRGPRGEYAIGVRLWELGLLSPLHHRLRETALPYLPELAAATGENAHLAVRDGSQALYVEKFTGARAVPILSRVGGRLPLHATGVGKALLAFQDPGFVGDYLREPLIRCTPYTIVEPGRLAGDLTAVRRRGWASTREEMTLGSCSVAVPVLAGSADGAGGGPVAVAAIGIVVHSRRTSLRPLLPAVRAAADQIAARLARRPVDRADFHWVEGPASAGRGDAAGSDRAERHRQRSRE